MCAKIFAHYLHTNKNSNVPGRWSSLGQTSSNGSVVTAILPSHSYLFNFFIVTKFNTIIRKTSVCDAKQKTQYVNKINAST
jgi:hypothetical protein